MPKKYVSCRFWSLICIAFFYNFDSCFASSRKLYSLLFQLYRDTICKDEKQIGINDIFSVQIVCGFVQQPLSQTKLILSNHHFYPNFVKLCTFTLTAFPTLVYRVIRNEGGKSYDTVSVFRNSYQFNENAGFLFKIFATRLVWRLVYCNTEEASDYANISFALKLKR